MTRPLQARPVTAASAVVLILLASAVGAHEIPTDVTIQTFLQPDLQPDGPTLRLLVRVPLQAMRDVEFPKRGAQGFLDLSRADNVLRDSATLWIADDIDMYEGDARLSRPRLVEVRASIASDTSFRTYEEALAHVTGPRLSDDTEFVWTQGWLDVLFEYPIQSDRSAFSMRPRWSRLGIRTVTVLRFMLPGGTVRAFEFVGDPGLVRLDPRWHQAAARFVRLGFLHILDGIDHLLFLACLVIPFRRFRALVPVVTAFTLAHSVTLIASAYGAAPDALWFPPLIEMLIAMSIVYMALENIAGASTVRRRWMIAFGFGLVHGFGFSFALRQTLQLAGSHLLTSLLSFNVGVELGQLVVLLVLIPALGALFRFVVAERMGTIILSALVAHTGWHWMTERGDRLRQYQVQWPVIDAALLASALRWMLAILIATAAVWLMSVVMRRSADEPAETGGRG